MSKEPGHVPIEDFNLAVEAVRIYTEVIHSMLDDISRSKVDIRILSKTTLQKTAEAKKVSRQLNKTIELAAANLINRNGDRH